MPVEPGSRSTQLYLRTLGPVQEEDHALILQAYEHGGAGRYRALKPEGLGRLISQRSWTFQKAVMSLRSDMWLDLEGSPVVAGSRSSREPFYVGLLRDFVAGLRFVGATRTAQDELPVKQMEALEASGENLTRVMDTLKANYSRQFDVIDALVKKMFPTVSDVVLTRHDSNVVLRVSSGRIEREVDAFRVSQVGAGIQQALLLATAVVSAAQGAMVLLEEPENNLHLGAQRQLAEWLRQQAIQGDKQILLTTHSTVFASNEDHCSTYLVRLDAENGTRVTKLEAADQPLVKEELGIRNVDLYGYNGVVLWEGDSEAQAMPPLLDVLAEKASTSVHALGLTSRNLYGHTNTRLHAVRQFLGLLDDLDIVPYVVMDDDDGVREELDRLVEDGLLPQGHYYVWKQGREMHGRNPGVGCEFEDNFSNEQLIAAATALAQDAGVTQELTVDEFAKRCMAPAGKTSDVLCKYYHEVTEYGLSKPDLARKLGELVAPELRPQAQRTVKEYEFEKVARDIFRKLGGLDVEDTSDLGREEQV
jgi:ABC-type enterochelin transport system ATPase subunit